MTDLAPGLRESQRALLGLLKRRGPTTIQELESAVDLSRESLRDHLRSLAAQGLVERWGVRRSGPGRPALVYRLTAQGERLFPQRQGELLRELATFLLADGGGDALERFFAARAEARRPRLRARVAGLEGEARVVAVATLLDEEGFLAETEPGADGEIRLRLCHCPLRELVEVSHVACRAELALVEELLGRSARRESFMPEGASSCTYSFAPIPARSETDTKPVEENRT